MDNSILNVKYEGKPCYDIVFTNSFDKLASNLEEIKLTGRKVMIVSETNVAPLYLKEVEHIINDISSETHSFVFPAGEASKNLDVVSELYEHLIEAKFDRNDVLIALGGGVVGDLTGFTASTYLRGIDFVQIPTSLLSQVDSSIGGKTGVDYKAFKNMVGAFYQPKLVYINTSTLNSLPDREFYSGMAEIIKHGIIKDREYFYWLMDNEKSIKERNPFVLRDMIYISCNIKRTVVEEDPKEKGDRALLNFGHTIGHAVEKLKNFKLLHGECVAIGIYSAAVISLNKNYILSKDLDSIRECLQLFNLPVNTDNIECNDIIEATLNDKKMSGNIIKFISINKIGNAFIDTSITRDDMLKSTIEIVK